MKCTLTLLLLLAPAAVLAQQPGHQPNALIQKMQSMTPEERQQWMQNMQQQANRMKQCYDDAGGRAAMERMQARGQQVSAEIRRLCAAGERNGALTYAMKEGKAMSSDPTVQKMRQCAQGWNKDMAFMQAGAPGKKHICDE